MLGARIVRCEITKTLQDPQFEPIKVTIGFEGEIADTDNYREEMEEIRNLCRGQVELELAEWVG
jgi:hypothetical protein